MSKTQRKFRKNNKANWGELILFVMVIAILYFILSLFGSSLTGENGGDWGVYLRGTWGGGVLILLLFWLYVCIAGFAKFKIPKFPRQLLGTLQLYISVAFLLGVLKNLGWDSDWTIFNPGSIGFGIAKFFILNSGTFITLVLVVISFLFSAYLFGSKLLDLTLPSVQSIQLPENLKLNIKRRKTNYTETPDVKNEPFTLNLPEPKFTPREDTLISILSSVNRNTSDEEYLNENENENINTSFELENSAIEKIDRLLDSFEAGDFAPPNHTYKKNNRINKTKRNRRPFPDVLNNQKNVQNTKIQDEYTEDNYDPENSVFPPPIEIFGRKQNNNISNETDKASKIYERQGRILTQTLRNFDVNASVEKITSGYQVVNFELSLSAGTKLNKITNLSDELAMSLGVTSVRIEAPILGTKFVGVEIPILERKTLTIRTILESKTFRKSTSKLPIPLGVTTDSEFIIKGLEDLNHILISGANRTGKSVFINSCILSICSKSTPEELRIILTNTKHVEFSIYESLPHLLMKTISEPENVIKTLSWTLKEAELRTEKFAAARARNINAYNQIAKNQNLEIIPNLVVIIDELSDLMLSKAKETENLLVRIAQKSRALGIFLIISTDKFSTDVITGLIKANIPTKITFMLPTLADSRTVLDYSGAEKLTGKGDMLLKTTDSQRLLRLQTPLTNEEIIPDFVDYMHNIFSNYKKINI